MRLVYRLLDSFRVRPEPPVSRIDRAVGNSGEEEPVLARHDCVDEPQPLGTEPDGPAPEALAPGKVDAEDAYGPQNE